MVVTVQTSPKLDVGVAKVLFETRHTSYHPYDVFPDGTSFTQTVYFTSEAEARAAEQQEPPADVRGLFEESRRLVVDPRYFDLRDPWLLSR